MFETLTLCGGAVCSKDSESEDELLLTTASNKRLQQESKQSHAKQKKSAYCSFHIKHPQAHTHEVCLLDETEGFVPNKSSSFNTKMGLFYIIMCFLA